MSRHIRGQREERAVHNPLLDAAESDGEDADQQPVVVAQPRFRTTADDLAIEAESEDDMDVLADRAAARAAKDKATRPNDVDLSDDFLSFGGGGGKAPDDDPFASGNDSVASEEDEGTNYEQYKRKKRLDRHFAGFGKRVRRADHDGSDNDAASSRGSSVGSSVDFREEANKAPFQHAPAQQQARNSFRGAVFEQYAAPHNALQADLTLMSITRPVSIRGECTVVGVTGESVVGGIYLGRGSVHLGPDDKCAVHPAPKLNIKQRQGIDDAQESPHGAINWTWVETRVKDWRERTSGSMPVLILVAYAKQPDAPLKFGQQQEEPAKKALPHFFNKFIVHGIETGLLPTVVPSLLKGKGASVAVVGCQNIGKSTHCRFLANALFGIHGDCLWLDLDLGQPEFGVSGTVSLSRVKKPLLRSNAHDCVEVLKTYFVGSSRVRCPVLMSRVLAQISRDTLSIRGDTPLVINTHGWIHSTGRRSTLEVLRRVQPAHVIHLLLDPARSNDEDATSPWLDAALLADATAGLNSTIIPKRFTLPFAPPLQGPINISEDAEETAPAKRKRMEGGGRPSAGDPNGAYELNVHGVTVDRDLTSKAAHQSRRAMWARYFGVKRRGEEVDVLPTVRVKLTDISVVSIGEAEPVGTEGLATALSLSVVGLCSGSSGPTGAAVSAAEAAPCCNDAFGLVVSSEHSIAATGEVVIATPAPFDGVGTLVFSSDRADTEWLAKHAYQLCNEQF